MKPSGKNSSSWWKKLGGFFASQESHQIANEGPETRVAQPQEPPASQAESAPHPKRGLTQYERFKLRMERIDETAAKRIATQKAKLRARKSHKGKAQLNSTRLRLIKDHRDALRLKKMQARNTWGRLESNEWERVLEQFIRTVLRAPRDEWPRWRKEVNRIIGPAALRKEKLNLASLGSSFELEVAAQLRALGWSVQLLGKSGDQGGDLLAQKKGKIVVVQCKNYSAKVGNAAVQEVAAARQFYHASSAVVVSRNGFTHQAHALADKTSVLLLSPDQLSILG